MTIDFSATGNYEFNPEAARNGIVKTAVMYGKNASGKSSLGLAIFDIVANLTDNFVNPRNYDIYQNALNMQKPVEFEFHFVFDGNELVHSSHTGREQLYIKYDKILLDFTTAGSTAITGSRAFSSRKNVRLLSA